MPSLSYYSNVHNTALVVLQSKGYRVWSDQDGKLICAEKDGWDFMADDPVQLLGLIAIHEFHQPAVYREYWWKMNEPWLLDSVPVIAPDYLPIWKK